VGKVQRFLSQPFEVAEVFTGYPGVFVKLEDTIKGFAEILSGKYDNLPEQSFYMVGDINDVVKKAEKIATDLATAKEKEKKAEEKKTDKVAAAQRGAVDQKKIVEKLLKYEKSGRQKQLNRAAKIKADDKGDGEIRPGFSYPNESKINENWNNWKSKFDTQSHDLSKLFESFMEESRRLRKEEEAKDALLGI